MKEKEKDDTVIWSHRSAYKKRNILKEAGNSRMFLFHQKTLFFSILFVCISPAPAHTFIGGAVYIYFSLSVLFTYSQYKCSFAAECAFFI